MSGIIRLMTYILALLGALIVLPGAAADSDLIARVLKGDHRDPANVERDIYRHPKETLEFFGWQPGMTVVEIQPSRGWYTEILAPLTRNSGKYYAAAFPKNPEGMPEYRVKIQKAFLEKLQARPDIYDRVIVTELALPTHQDIAPAGSADLVLTFRNVHNWMKDGHAEDMFKLFNQVLKPNGILGVVEHRAKDGTPVAGMIKSGYVTEEEVIRLASEAGFTLEQKSEINANPKDTKNHPEGVWTLPPMLRYCGKLEDAAAKADCTASYKAIGESDRMTLRFRKTAG